jgi:hypothetical protein
MLIHIRRNKTNAVIAHIEIHDDGVALKRLTPDAGAVPFCDDLHGKQFQDVATLRRIILDRMRSLARGEPERNLLDRIALTTAHYQRWLALTQTVDFTGIEPDAIPTETAQVLRSGDLRIFVEGYLEMIVPASEWHWIDQ